MHHNTHKYTPATNFTSFIPFHTHEIERNQIDWGISAKSPSRCRDDYELGYIQEGLPAFGCPPFLLPEKLPGWGVEGAKEPFIKPKT